MEDHLKHEDLLLKLRGKLNAAKIKLWEPPYVDSAQDISESLKELAKKYSVEFSLEETSVLEGLRELQLHSLDKSKDNAEFQGTGVATFSVKVTLPGERPKVIKVHKKLDAVGSNLSEEIAQKLNINKDRIKLIHNGKVINPAVSLSDQGLKNGAQIMALILTENPEEVKKEDKMYMEMKATRDDAMLLSECVDELMDDEEYMKLEDQSGKAIELPQSEKRALLVGLALHERGRTAMKQKNYSLALVLLLEADRQLSECSSSILSSVDNWAMLQLDIAWCYLCLQSLAACSDVAKRLSHADSALKASYGENSERVMAVKGNAANEQVLLMRLHLLQGIAAYHQNDRERAKSLLNTAQMELNSLGVDEGAVAALREVGWGASAARAGLRAARGDPDAAHALLSDARARRERARQAHDRQREIRNLGNCEDGSRIDEKLLETMEQMGCERLLAAKALKNTNNRLTEALDIIKNRPELLVDSDSDESVSSNDVIADDGRVAEMVAMGYEAESAKKALSATANDVAAAVALLVAAGGCFTDANSQNPSTSTAHVAKRKLKKRKDSRRREREMALRRLKRCIKTEEDDYIGGSLSEEERFLQAYLALL